jgi:hypothetical protein
VRLDDGKMSVETPSLTLPSALRSVHLCFSTDELADGLKSMLAECVVSCIAVAWLDCQKNQKTTNCWCATSDRSLLQGTELPQSQIPDTIIRGNGQFGRTFKTIARIRFIRMDDQADLGSLDLLTRDLLVTAHGFRVCQGR